MGFLAGETVTADRLNRLQPTVYFAIGSGMVVGAQTNADVPSATITLTTQTAGATYTAECVWDVDLTGATTATGTARMMLDGTAQPPLAVFGQEVATDRLTTAQNYSGTLATAGSHTFKLVASPAANQQIQGVNSSIKVTIYEVV
ncbi:hypothetical protein ACWERV_17015 [Streptomyces sp. NPDC004031]